MALTKSFEELHCWQAATEIRRELSKVVRTFPEKEKFALSSQLIRASRSVTNNIAEGFGRYHYQEYIKFCRISRGSLSEVVDHLIIARDKGYISSEQVEEIRVKIDRCRALINGFIKYMRSQKEKGNDGTVEEPIFEYAIKELTNQRISQSTNQLINESTSP